MAGAASRGRVDCRCTLASALYTSSSYESKDLRRMWSVSSPAWGNSFFFSSRRRHTRLQGDWSSDVCSSDLVRKLKMIPVEAVVRGYLYGSLYERLTKSEISIPVEPILAAKLPEPYFDPTTKSDVKDEPVTTEQIEEEGWLDPARLDAVRKKTVEIYNKMSLRAEKAGFILADLKLEFGFDKQENIVLADSIGPDEFRLWPRSDYSPGKTQESYDKQPIRDWPGKVGYKKTLDEARREGRTAPRPPDLPADLIQETSRRYIIAYERLTGLKL